MLNPAFNLSHVIMAFSLALFAVLIALGRKGRPFIVFASSFTVLAISYILFLVVRSDDGVVLAANVLIFASQCLFAWGLREFSPRKDSWPRRFFAYLAAFAVLQYWAVARVGDMYLWNAISAFFAAIAGVEALVAIVGIDRLQKPARAKAFGVFALIVLYQLSRVSFFVIGMAWNLPRPLFENLVATSVIISMALSILRMAIVVIIDSAQLLRAMEEKNAELEGLALKDELTGLLNRHTLEGTISSEALRQDRYRSPLSLVMIDIDHFKRVNDTWGHDIGDRVLVEVARRIKANLRETDLFFRWGGEELLVLAPGTGLAGATSLAEKLRCALCETPMPDVGTVTASFGVVERAVGEHRESCFKRVDQAMYGAKTRGRNRVEAWTNESLAPEASVKLDWRPEWESGNDAIDGEHRTLVEKGAALMNLSLAHETHERLLSAFDDLLADIRMHFSHEEEILSRAGYPDLEEHRAIHATLVAEAASTRDALAGKLGEASRLFHLIVESIVMGHMMTVDSKFFPYLAQRANNSR